MKCFKVTASEVENSVTIDGIVFSPQECTSEEELIVKTEMKNHWCIEEYSNRSVEYYELSSSSSKNTVLYVIKESDAVIFNNRVIGFVMFGCDPRILNYNPIRNRYFPIDGRDNFYVSHETTGSYDHGDGDVVTTYRYYLRTLDPKKLALINEYCIKWEEKGETTYEEISYNRIVEEETGLKVLRPDSPRCCFNRVGETVRVTIYKFATLVRKEDINCNELGNNK